MVAVTIELPDIDGEAEVGIAVGTDKGLPAERKLHVLRAGTRAEKVMYAAASAALIDNAANKDLMLCAGIATEKFKLYRQDKSGIGPDSDVIIDMTPTPNIEAKANRPEFQAQVANLMKAKRDVDALAVIVASKVTFWQTNHHTGGPKLCHYAKKVYDLKFRDENAEENVSSEAATSDVHTAAHWASTCYVLHKVGFAKVRDPLPIDGDRYANWTITSDVELRKSIFPAGCAKHGACREVLKRIFRTPLIAAFPKVSDCTQFLEECEEIKANEANYHIGAEYLSESGVKRTVSKPTIAHRCGTFVKVFFPRTKLAEASAFSNEAMMTYEDVFNNWERLLKKFVVSDIDDDLDVNIFGGVAVKGADPQSLVAISATLAIPLPEETKVATNHLLEAAGLEKFFR